MCDKQRAPARPVKDRAEALFDGKEIGYMSTIPEPDTAVEEAVEERDALQSELDELQDHVDTYRDEAEELDAPLGKLAFCADVVDHVLAMDRGVPHMPA
jgi:hypothetical protein